MLAFALSLSQTISEPAWKTFPVTSDLPRHRFMCFSKAGEGAYTVDFQQKDGVLAFQLEGGPSGDRFQITSAKITALSQQSETLKWAAEFNADNERLGFSRFRMVIDQAEGDRKPDHTMIIFDTAGERSIPCVFVPSPPPIGQSQ